MNIVLLLIITIIGSAGWLKLWISSYTPSNVRGYVAHTLIFTVLSFIISGLVLLLIFAPVDDTYSASNVGALGMLFLGFIGLFGCFCLVAVFFNFGKLMDKREERKNENKNE